jgi:hypothetical protein
MRHLIHFTGIFIIIGIFLIGCDAVMDSDYFMEKGKPAGSAAMSTMSSSVNTVIVTGNNIGVDWFFGAESGSGNGELVVGPSSPFIGSGSAEISINTGGDGFVLAGLIGLGERH